MENYRKYVISILEKHGLTPLFYEVGIESGSDEWMEIVEDITGENPYEGLSLEGNYKVNRFIEELGEMGIELW